MTFAVLVLALYIGTVHNLLKDWINGNDVTFLFALSIVLVLLIGASVPYIFGNLKLFKKMNEKSWKSLVPVYEVFVPCKKLNKISVFVTEIGTAAVIAAVFAFTNGAATGTLGSLVTQLILFSLGFIVLLISNVILCNELAKVCGKRGNFDYGLLFLPFVFVPILGFGKAEFNGKLKKRE